MPDALQLQVKAGDWIEANYGTNALRRIVIRCPGDAPNGEAWEGADWLGTWARCMRARLAAAALKRFCRNLAADLALEDRVAAELHRLAGRA